MNTTDVRAAVEAVLMVVDDPVTVADLAAAVEAPQDDVASALAELAADYRGEGDGPRRGFELREVAGGWRIYSAPEHEQTVTRFVRGGATTRLSRAALETLAIVAYRQPVTRGHIASVRGVNVDGVMRTLVARGLVEDVGQDHSTGATRYATTRYFLERMGLDSLEDLPPLAPNLPDLSELDDVPGLEWDAPSARGPRTTDNEG